MEIRHQGGVSVVWREYAGWQVEEIFSFGRNVASFLLTSGSRRWYIVGAYVPPNDVPAIRCIKQVLEEAPKGMEVILLGDLNVRLREKRDAREDELATALEDSGMGDVTAYFMPRWRYRGMGDWTWRMR